MSRGTAHAVIRQIEALRYAVGVHHMVRYVKMHAVQLTGEEIQHVARCEDGGEEARYTSAPWIWGNGGHPADGLSGGRPSAWRNALGARRRDLNGGCCWRRRSSSSALTA